MPRSAGSRAFGSYKHRFWVRFIYVTAVTTLIRTTPDLQTYPHSPFLIVPSCFLLTISPSFLLLPNSRKRRNLKKKKKSPASQWLTLSPCWEEWSLVLTCPCLLFFNPSAHWGNNGNWAAASPEGSSAFSESQVGSLSQLRGAVGCAQLPLLQLFLGEQPPALQSAIPRRMCWKPGWKLFWLARAPLWTAPAQSSTNSCWASDISRCLFTSSRNVGEREEVTLVEGGTWPHVNPATEIV